MQGASGESGSGKEASSSSGEEGSSSSSSSREEAGSSSGKEASSSRGKQASGGSRGGGKYSPDQEFDDGTVLFTVDTLGKVCHPSPLGSWPFLGFVLAYKLVLQHLFSALECDLAEFTNNDVNGQVLCDKLDS